MAIAAFLMLVGGACSSDDTATPATTTSPTTTAATPDSTASDPDAVPVQGDCLEPMTEPIANSAQMPAIVDCANPHGGEVVSMDEIPEPKDGSYPAWSGGIDGADEQVQSCVGSKAGPGSLETFLGSKALPLTDEQVSAGAADAYAVSGIQYAVYVPGPAAWSNGERWLACAAVLSNSGKTPSSYTGSLRDALAKPGSLDVQFSWCKQQEPNARDTFTVLPCSEPHNYEQLASFTSGSDDAPYPGDGALGALSQELCPELSAKATGGRSDDLPDGIGLGWTYPLESEWADGDRSVRCFAVTDGSSTGGVAMGTAEVSGG